MNRSQKLVPLPDLIQILTQLSHPSFNILVNYLKNLKELNGYSDKLGRFLRLRRLDSKGVSRELATLINSSSSLKEYFIKALFEKSSDTIRPELFLIPEKNSSNLQEIDHSGYIDPEIENSISESYIRSSFLEEEEKVEIRPPIPYFEDRLIKSIRKNYLPLDQLIQKFSVLEPEEIENIWRRLTESKLITPQFYQSLLNELIIDKDSSTRTFLKQIEQDERLLCKMADLLWDRGVNIYSPEGSGHLEKDSDNITTTMTGKINERNPIETNIIYRKPSRPFLGKLTNSNSSKSFGFESTPFQRNSNLYPTTDRIIPFQRNSQKEDRSILQSWIILKQNISLNDREMIGNWIGLSEKQVRIFKERVGSISSFLPDRAHIIRAIDVLKTKYDRPAWLVDLARRMEIRLGYPPSRSVFNSVRKSYKLTPIKIDS